MEHTHNCDEHMFPISHPKQEETAPWSESSHADQYRSYFCSVSDAAHATLSVSKERMLSHGIRLHVKTDFKLYKTTKVVVVDIECGAAVVTYDVLLGPYIVNVRMLNVDDRILEESKESLGKGTFGSIIPLNDEFQEFAAKRIKFQETLQLKRESCHGEKWVVNALFCEVEKVIVEYAIAKVCSMLCIGPKIKLDIGFDLVCYRDCIEFFMERCEPAASLRVPKPDPQRLKFLVAAMHEHRMIHRDIKPTNLVWSPSIGDYALCDFGVSCTVFEEPGYKTLSAPEGTGKYMCAELKCMRGSGYTDLYFNDMFALSLTIDELHGMQNLNLVKVREATPSGKQTAPNPRITFLRELNGLLKGNYFDATFQHKMMMRQYLAGMQVNPKAEFLLSSMEISFELQNYLQRAGLDDGRVRHIMQRIKGVLNRPNFVKRKFEQIETSSSQHLTRSNVMAVSYAEFKRLRNSLFRSADEEVRYWRIMEYFINIFSREAEIPPKMTAIFDEFKQKQVLPNQVIILKKMDILSRIGRQDCSTKFEEIVNMAIRQDYTVFFQAIQCYFARGCYLEGFEMILLFGELMSKTSYGWLLRHLQKFYARVKDKSILDPAQLCRQLSSLKEDEGWTWLKQFHLLAISLIYTNPGQCVDLCNKYRTKLGKQYRKNVLSLQSQAYQKSGMLAESIACQQQFVSIVQFSGEHDRWDWAEAKLRLLVLQSNLPSSNLDVIHKEAGKVVNELKVRYTHNPLIVRFYEFIVLLLRKQGKHEEADLLLSSEEEKYISQNYGTTVLIDFYLSKIAVQFGLIKKAQGSQKVRLLNKVEQFVTKSYSILPNHKSAASPAILLALCRVGVYRNAFEEADNHLREAVLSGPLEMRGYYRVFGLSADIIKWYLSNQKQEQVKRLLRCLISHLQILVEDHSKIIEVYIHKLWFITQYGRLSSLEDDILNEFHENTLIRIMLDTKRCVYFLHKVAVKLTNMGLHKDALKFFRAAPVPNLLDSATIIALSTSHFHAGDPKVGIQLLLSIEGNLESGADLLEKAHFWKILSLCLSVAQEHVLKELYLGKAFDAYLKLRLQSLRYYADIGRMKAQSSLSVSKTQTFSGELRLLYKLARKQTDSLKRDRKTFLMQLARHDVFYLTLLSKAEKSTDDGVKLCEAYALLRKRRRLLQRYSQLRKQPTALERFRSLFHVMDSEKLWAEKLVLSGQLPKKCDEVTLAILGRFINTEQTYISNTRELLKTITIAKKLNATIMIMKSSGLVESQTVALLKKATAQLHSLKQKIKA